MPWLEPWVRFDAGYYLAIAREGYGDPWPNPDPEKARRKAAFLPLLPWCIEALSALGLNAVLAAVLVTNLSFVGGLCCAGRVALQVYASPRTAWLGVLVLVSFPTAFYFSAPDQESLYLLATAGGLLAWLNHRPGITATAGFVAALGRLTAVALPLGLFADALARRRWPKVARLVALATAVGVGVALQSIAGTKSHHPPPRRPRHLGSRVAERRQYGSHSGRAVSLVQPNPVYAT